MNRFLLSTICLSLTTAFGCSSNDTQGSTDGPVQTNMDMAGTTQDLNNPADMTQAAPPTEFLVMRVGTGTAAMTSNVATAAFIERRKIADGSLVGQATALPVAASGTNHVLTLSGLGTSEGALSRSADGRYVLFAGYDSTPGTTSVVDNAMRVVGRMDQAGTVDTTTVVDTINGAGNFVRSATSLDGTSFWVSGVVGIAYTTLGHTGAPIAKPLGSAANSRVVSFFDGQLYVSKASDTSGGISKVGTGAPMTDSVTATQLSGFPTSGNLLSPYGFVAFDTDSTSGIDVLYIADDRTNGSGGVQRWRLSGTTWMLEGTLTVGASAGCRGLAGYRSGTSITLIASTAETNTSRVVSFTDNGGTPGSLSATMLATAGTNTAFRGVALPPSQ